MERIIKTAKFLDMFLKVFWIILLVAGAVVIGFTAVMMCAPNLITHMAERSPGFFSFTFGAMIIRLNVLTASQYRILGAILAVSVVVVFTLIGVIVRLLKSITRDMSGGRPFSVDIPLRIRQIAFVIIAYAFVSPLFPLVPFYAISKIVDLPQVLSTSPSVESIEIGFTYSPDLNMGFVALIVILLSFVFEYGARLQQESDETL